MRISDENSPALGRLESAVGALTSRDRRAEQQHAGHTRVLANTFVQGIWLGAFGLITTVRFVGMKLGNGQTCAMVADRPLRECVSAKDLTR